MSESNLRIALFKQVDAITPKIETSWPNAEFVVPDASGDNVKPWQRVTLLAAQNTTPFRLQSTPVLRKGILVVTLFYPPSKGEKDALARAELIQSNFSRGLALSQGDTTVRIEDIPSILPALPEAAWYAVPVHIPYYSYDFG